MFLADQGAEVIKIEPPAATSPATAGNRSALRGSSRPCSSRQTESDHPEIGRVRLPVPPARFDRIPAAIQGPAPRIGEHSRALLAELGLEPAEIDRLVAEKIVRSTAPR
jgi:crotonobetainyl-CoA:carnitine CoA-transferase CaiB-like acyl-CoA transferase